MFSGITTILFSSFWQYPPYFAVNSFKYIRQISAKFPSISTIFCHKFAHYFATNLLIILPQICSLQWPNLPKFVHYDDEISSKFRKYGILWNTIPNISNNIMRCVSIRSLLQIYNKIRIWIYTNMIMNNLIPNISKFV